jgi:hypothetical protein
MVRISAERNVALGMLVTLAALGSVGFAREAEACSPPPSPGWYVSGAGDVPADGALVLIFHCYGECPKERPDVTVIVRDGDEKLVGGDVLESQFGETEGWATWVPTERLASGRKYEITVDSDDFTEPYEWQFQSTEATSDVPRRDELAFTAEAMVQTQGERVCCEESALDSCGQKACFTWSEADDVVVRLSLEIAQSSSQFVVSGEFRTRQETVPLDARVFYGMTGVLMPADMDDEYCYEITARHLVTGQETTFSDCIPASDVPLPHVSAELAQRREDDLRSCIVPPQEHEDAWCDAFADRIGTARCSSDECQNATAVCPPRDNDASCTMAPDQPAQSHPWRFLALLAIAGVSVRRLRKSRSSLVPG